MVAATLAAALSFATLIGLRSAPDLSGSTAAGPPAAHIQSALTQLASRHPSRQVEVIIQLQPGTNPSAGGSLVRAAGGSVIGKLPIINGLGARMPAGGAQGLSADAPIRAVSLNSEIKAQGRLHARHRRGAHRGRAHHRATHHRARGHGAHRHGGSQSVAYQASPASTTSGGVDPSKLATSYPQSIRADKAWALGDTGKGVGVAVIDTGIAGNLPDFQVSRSDSTSRVVASAVVNPAASSAGDSLGHGTHIAGLIAGNSWNRPAGDPLAGKYVGVAPDANLIDVKAADDNGDATVLDVIDGLQFAVDFQQNYNIRVVNLSLKSSSSESYRTDPLDAAVEAAWNSGIVVVAAAGNQGADSDAVSYAPANDPYVITVGAVDDQGNKGTGNDLMTSWSSRGVTQDGYVKPDILAPGAHIVSTIAPGSPYTQMCPSCITDGSYFKVGGTSMAAAIVSGEAADAIQANPGWTPNQVKAQLVNRSRPVKNWSAQIVDGAGTVQNNGDNDVLGGEGSLDKVLNNPINSTANSDLTPNDLINPATGQIDYSRASWSRASWSQAVDPLRASWSRASWSRASWSRASWSATPQSCTDFERASWSRASWSAADISMAQQQCANLLSKIDPSRASWSRASWSRASWSTSFDK
jgi:serine protease AprX